MNSSLGNQAIPAAARAEVSAFSMPARGNWLEVDEVDDNQQLERAERYLTARGLLERNRNNPRQVRILKRPRPWAPEGVA